MSQRLFIARVSRLRGTYTFTARCSRAASCSTSRPIAIRRCTSMRPRRRATVRSAAQALLSYKLNWQSVMFVGYGDDRELTDHDQLVKSGRQLFVKISYAFQR